MHITHVRIKSGAKVLLFLHIRKFLVPFLQKTCILPHSMSKNEEASLPERVRNESGTLYTRIQLDIAPNDTPNIPKGYPKDTTIKLVNTCFILYIRSIYTFCCLLSEFWHEVCRERDKRPQALPAKGIRNKDNIVPTLKR